MIDCLIYNLDMHHIQLGQTVGQIWMLKSVITLQETVFKILRDRFSPLFTPTVQNILSNQENVLNKDNKIKCYWKLIGLNLGLLFIVIFIYNTFIL